MTLVNTESTKLTHTDDLAAVEVLGHALAHPLPSTLLLAGIAHTGHALPQLIGRHCGGRRRVGIWCVKEIRKVDAC